MTVNSDVFVDKSASRLPASALHVGQSPRPQKVTPGKRVVRTPFDYLSEGDSASFAAWMQSQVQLSFLAQIHDKLDRNLLHYAIASNMLEEAAMLLRHGVNVNHGDTYGIAPLHLAAITGNTEAIRLLLKSGADVSKIGAITVDGLTHLDSTALTLSSHYHGKSEPTLVLAAENYIQNTERYGRILTLIYKGFIEAFTEIRDTGHLDDLPLHTMKSLRNFIEKNPGLSGITEFSLYYKEELDLRISMLEADKAAKESQKKHNKTSPDTPIQHLEHSEANKKHKAIS